VSKYKGPANDPLTAGHALGVDAILSGTVQRSVTGFVLLCN
jgi:TolB-like protein